MDSSLRKLFSLSCLILLLLACSDSRKPAPDAQPPALPRADDQGMLRIPGGSFTMGNTGLHLDVANEGPTRSVRISAFYLGQSEVTQAEFKALMDSDPSHFKGEDRPVESVGWFGALQYCNRLSEREGLQPCYTIAGDYARCDFDATGYRLPTEAEWEYACRAGTKTDFFSGEMVASPGDCRIPDPNLARVAWYCANSGDSTHRVGTKEANAFGLHGMHGNVAEWVWDRFGLYRVAGETENPTGPDENERRVVRGGAWKFSPEECRSSRRIPVQPDFSGYPLNYVGFRVARSAGPS